MTRTVWALGFAAAAWMGGVAWARAQDGTHWLQLAGAAWRGYSVGERQAYATGFLTGAALQQADMGGAADSAVVAATLDSLRRSGRLSFPYAPTLYASRLSDYYWWENHRPEPLWQAMREVDRELKKR